MSAWLTVRTFIALFLAILGIGMMLTTSIFVGAAIAAIGLTFLVRLAIAFRQNLP